MDAIGRKWPISPEFALSGAIGGAEADVIADGILIDLQGGKGDRWLAPERSTS
jgi:hypothetical protein